jgi:hypothetical protein
MRRFGRIVFLLFLLLHFDFHVSLIPIALPFIDYLALFVSIPSPTIPPTPMTNLRCRAGRISPPNDVVVLCFFLHRKGSIRRSSLKRWGLFTVAAVTDGARSR